MAQNDTSTNQRAIADPFTLYYVSDLQVQLTAKI